MSGQDSRELKEGDEIQPTQDHPKSKTRSDRGGQRERDDYKGTMRLHERPPITIRDQFVLNCDLPLFGAPVKGL
jgi:hypothetical protein